MIPAVKAYVRPDGRHFVRDPDPESLAEATTDVYCTVEASEIDSYLALGFDVHRREGTYLVPIRSARAEAAQGVVFARADEVDETTLRLLDNELRQDVPGTDGWQWDEDDFREETYEAAEFDPTTYLVALDGETGECVGIVRVWMKQPIPRLGFIGVRPRYRRRGIARALLAESTGTGSAESELPARCVALSLRPEQSSSKRHPTAKTTRPGRRILSSGSELVEGQGPQA